MRGAGAVLALGKQRAGAGRARGRHAKYARDTQG